MINNAKELQELFEILLVVLNEKPYTTESGVTFELYNANSILITYVNHKKVFSNDLNDITELNEFITEDFHKMLNSKKTKRLIKRKGLFKNNVYDI